MNITPKGHERRAMIARLAATPEGFSLRKTEGHPTKSCAKIVGDQFLAGEVCRVPTSSRFIWYFASREHARAFAGPHGVVEWHPLRTDSKTKPAAKPKVKVSPMPPKPTFNFPRGGLSAGSFKPKQAAVVIWTENVKHTIIPTPAPKNFTVSHSFIHGGVGVMR